MELKKIATFTTFLCLGASSLQAAGTAITGTMRTGAGDNILTSILVGSETYSASYLVTGTSTRGITDHPRTETQFYDGSLSESLGNNYDVGVNNVELLDNYDLLHGASLRNTLNTGWTTSNFGGLGNYVDTNDDGFDFFVFERSGNDTLRAQAVYSYDGGETFILGDDVLIASANNSNHWGGTGYTNTENPPPGSAQQVFGTAFKITDLRDADGVALTNDAIISRIEFISPGLDPRIVLAAVPEPSSVGLLGIALACLAARRSRKQG